MSVWKKAAVHVATHVASQVGTRILERVSKVTSDDPPARAAEVPPETVQDTSVFLFGKLLVHRRSKSVTPAPIHPPRSVLVMGMDGQKVSVAQVNGETLIRVNNRVVYDSKNNVTEPEDLDITVGISVITVKPKGYA